VYPQLIQAIIQLFNSPLLVRLTVTPVITIIIITITTILHVMAPLSDVNGISARDKSQDLTLFLMTMMVYLVYRET